MKRCYAATLALSLLVFVLQSDSYSQTVHWNGVDERKPLLDELEFDTKQETGYSFSIWVKLSGTDPNFPSIASSKEWENGDILDLLSSRNMGKTLKTGSGLGWTIAVQPNGAWTWNIGDGKKQRLDYIPTERQRITDDNWHLLAFTVNATKNVARLYFDGKNVAIYSINSFAQGTFSRNVFVGGDRKEKIAPCRISGTIDSATSFSRELDSEEVFQIYRQRFPNAMREQFEKPVEKLNVLSWNIWHGARHPGIEKGINQAIAFIEHSNADIITMQETYGSGPVIADRAGYYFFQRSDNLSIMSRYPIEEIHRLYRPLWFGGATIRLSKKQSVIVFCLWLNHLPAWRRDSQVEGATARSLIAADWNTRAKEMKSILSELRPFIDNSDQIPLLVGGDFNSPSMLDWVKETADWHNGLTVRWPVSEQMLDQGFVDAYRAIHPDPTRHAEHELWNRDAKALTYRIDYLYSRGDQISVTDAKMMNVHEGGWPSDHPAVLATYQLTTKPTKDSDQREKDSSKKLPSPKLESQPWQLQWHDEFDNDDLDESKWSRCRRGRPAWRDTMSDDSKLLKIQNGILELRGVENPHSNEDPAPFHTAGITSKNKFSFQYGKIQIRARFKSAQGAWPALWMMGTERGWRGKGEIDLMEHLNFDDHVYQTVHSEYTLKIDKSKTPPRFTKVNIQRDDWNTYGCEWDQNEIIFTVNGVPTFTYPRMPEKGEKQWSFDQPFYLILSMQIGGSWVNGSGPTDPTHYPAGMEIDWVRVYQRSPTESAKSD